MYETDFLGFYYGFRQAAAITKRRMLPVAGSTGSWILEHGIGDRRMLRLIGKWLKGGVLEEGRLLMVNRSTRQGAVIWPLLATIYLQYV